MIISQPLGQRPTSTARNQPGWLLAFPFPRGPELVLVLAGEADTGTAAQLREQVTDALSLRPRRLVLDVADLDVCDLQGWGALHDCATAARAAGSEVAYRGLPPLLSRMHAVIPLPRAGAG